MTLASKTVQAYKWNTLSQVVNQAVLLTTNIVLVRLLIPEDFGMVAIPFIVFSLVRLIQDLGYSDVLLKSSDDEVTLHASVFWLIILVGSITSILYFIGFASFGKVDIRIISGYAITLVIGSFCIAYEAMLKKEFSFKKLFYADLTANVLSGAIGILLAWQGWGWLALIIRVVLQYAISFWYYILSVKWRPEVKLDFRLLSVSKTFAAINIFDQVLAYLSKNIDTFIIGLRFDKMELGLYDRAYKLVNLPVQQTTGALSKVMLPEMANMESTSEVPVLILRRNIKVSSTVIIPISLFLYCNASCIVSMLFGVKWMGIVTLFQTFALSAWFQTILSIFNPYMVAGNSNRDFFHFSLLSKLIIIIGLVGLCFSTDKLVSIAYGYLLLNVLVCIMVAWMMHNRYCKGLIDKEFLMELGKLIVAVVITACFHLILKKIGMSCDVELIVMAAVDMVMYVGLLVLMRAKLL